MDSFPPFQDTETVFVASRFPAFPAMVKLLGIAPEWAEVLEPEEWGKIGGGILISDSPELPAVLRCSLLIHVPLQIPLDVDLESLTPTSLQRWAGTPQVFAVSAGSRAVLTGFDAGPTAVAGRIAAEVTRRVRLGDNMDAIVRGVDQALYAERKAGAESEKMLLRMLGIERDRRLTQAGQLFFGAVPQAPPPGGGTFRLRRASCLSQCAGWIRPKYRSTADGLSPGVLRSARRRVVTPDPAQARWEG